MNYRASYYISVTGAVLFVLVAFTLLAPLILPEDIITGSLPECEYKLKYNKECAACGLTRAFCEIPKGNLPEASRLNSASVPLYTVFLLYQIIFIFFYIKFFHKKLTGKIKI